MTSSASLRDLYSSPPASWSFVPSSSNSSSSSSSTFPKHEWSTRPATNPVFDLSPSLPFEHDGFNIETRLILKGIVASAVMQYASTALAMPWEVGKLLLQIQWVPRESEELQTDVAHVTEDDELSDESSDEAYFQEPPAPSLSRYAVPKPRLSDEEGYVVRRSVLEEDTRPDYIMPIGRIDGVWGMIKRIARWRNEGWFALWKGLLTSCVTNFLSTSIQPFVHNLLVTVFSPVPISTPTLLFPFASHLFTGLLLSPLDLVRTRLIAQSSLPLHRTYTGPIDALSKLLRDEGGFRGLYLHPHLLIPATLDNAVRPLVMIALPSLFATRLGINENSNWLVWSVTELAAGSLGAIVTIPIETARRRLQVQTRGTGRFKACVETRPRQYHGVVDTVWRILTEERSDGPRLAKKAGSKGKSDEDFVEDEGVGWMQTTGIGQLYRGLGMSIGATAVVTILAIVAGSGETETGWAEL